MGDRVGVLFAYMWLWHTSTAIYVVHESELFLLGPTSTVRAGTVSGVIKASVFLSH